MLDSYEVTATRKGNWWEITIPALSGVTQACSRKDIDLMAREFIATHLDIEPEDVTVKLTTTAS